MRAAISLGVLLALLVGCTGTLRVSELDLVSTERVPLRTAILKRNVTGRACTTFAFSGMPNLEQALAEAQRSVANGEALANVGVYIERTYYFVATRLCYVVIGDAVKLNTE
jgi:hypothetical protein